MSGFADSVVLKKSWTIPDFAQADSDSTGLDRFDWFALVGFGSAEPSDHAIWGGGGCR